MKEYRQLGEEEEKKHDENTGHSSFGSNQAVTDAGVRLSRELEQQQRRKNGKDLQIVTTTFSNVGDVAADDDGDDDDSATQWPELDFETGEMKVVRSSSNGSNRDASYNTYRQADGDNDEVSPALVVPTTSSANDKEVEERQERNVDGVRHRSKSTSGDSMPRETRSQQSRGGGEEEVRPTNNPEANGNAAGNGEHSSVALQSSYPIEPSGTYNDDTPSYKQKQGVEQVEDTSDSVLDDAVDPLPEQARAVTPVDTQRDIVEVDVEQGAGPPQQGLSVFGMAVHSFDRFQSTSSTGAVSFSRHSSWSEMSDCPDNRRSDSSVSTSSSVDLLECGQQHLTISMGSVSSQADSTSTKEGCPIQEGEEEADDCLNRAISGFYQSLKGETTEVALPEINAKHEAAPDFMAVDKTFTQNDSGPYHHYDDKRIADSILGIFENLRTEEASAEYEPSDITSMRSDRFREQPIAQLSFLEKAQPSAEGEEKGDDDEDGDDKSESENCGLLMKILTIASLAVLIVSILIVVVSVVVRNSASPAGAVDPSSGSPTDAPTGVDASCKDYFGVFEAEDGEYRNCNWLAVRPAEWSELLCKKSVHARTMCPKTCNVCGE